MPQDETLIESLFGLLILGFLTFKVFPPLIQQLDIDPVFMLVMVLAFLIGLLQILGEIIES